MRKPNVCIIGGGIFSLSIAYHLSSIAKKIEIFEKNKDLMSGATFFNHNRHHYGYHYPRSDETVDQCLRSKLEFERVFNESLDFDFENYYAISKNKSKVNKYNFEKFCNRNNLKYKKVLTPVRLFKKNKIASCYKVNEGVYNFNKLKKISINRLKLKKNININLNAYISDIDVKKKTISLSSSKKKKFDIIINATYDELNTFITNKNEKVLFEYNLQEMVVLNIPKLKRFGITILDGEFPSILPLSIKKNHYLFAHVRTSQLIKETGYKKPSKIINFNNVLTNWKNTFEESKKILNVLNKSQYVRSFLTVRAVRLNKDKDTRLSEIIDHKNGVFSIFSGKIITCETIAKELVGKIRLLIE